MDTKIRKSEKLKSQNVNVSHTTEQKRKFQSMPTIPDKEKNYAAPTGDDLKRHRKEPVLSKISEEHVVPTREMRVHASQKPKRASKITTKALNAKLLEPKLPPPPETTQNKVIDPTLRIRKLKPRKRDPKDDVRKAKSEKSPSPARKPAAAAAATADQTGLKTYISGFQRLINKNIFEIFKPPQPIKKSQTDDVKVDIVYSRQLKKQRLKSEMEEIKRPHTAPNPKNRPSSAIKHDTGVKQQKRNEIAIKEKLMEMETVLKVKPKSPVVRSEHRKPSTDNQKKTPTKPKKHATAAVAAK